MKIRTLITRLFLVIITVIFLAVCTFSFVAWRVLAGREGDATLPADCGIVFGAAVAAVRNSQGSVIAEVAGPGIARRVDTAANLWKNRQIDRIFLSGGKGEGMGRSEAEVMRERAIAQGIDASKIVIEDTSTSTVENLQNVKPLTKDCKSIVAISDGYHLTRIKFLAWQQGIQLGTVPAERGAGRAFETWSMFRETLGIIYYALPLN